MNGCDRPGSCLLLIGALYIAATVMCLIGYRDQSVKPLAPVLLFICLVWIALLLPALGPVSVAEIIESVSMQTQAVEEAREIGGLALVALWAAVVTARRPSGE